MLPLRRFSRQLRLLRATRGYSQEALAERTGVSAAYIGMLERGERNPPLTTLHALAQALGLDTAQLLHDGSAAPFVLQPGAAQHVLHLYRTPAERTQVAREARAAQAVALNFATPRRADPAAALQRVDQRVGEVVEEGAGLILLALSGGILGDAQALAAHEANLTATCNREGLSCLCQYALGDLSGPSMADVFRSHAWLLVSGREGTSATRLVWRGPRRETATS